MSIDIRIPNITAKNPEGQLQQMQSYMFQLVEQLNWALKSVEAAETSNVVVQTPGASTSVSEKAAQSTFNSIKALIIKSAEIIDSYYAQISKRLEGEYVAQSDFGTYKQTTSNDIAANSASIKQFYENLQQIIADIDTLEDAVIDVNAYINSGLLYYDENGVPVYGLEVGQRTKIDDVETFNQFARFTANKLSFYDSNGYEAAYVSDKKLFIQHAEITGSFTLGKLVDTVLSDGSVVTK